MPLFVRPGIAGQARPPAKRAHRKLWSVRAGTRRGAKDGEGVGGGKEDQGIDVTGAAEGHGAEGGIGTKMSKTVEIKPGTKLDAAVAETFGLNLRLRPNSCVDNANSIYLREWLWLTGQDIPNMFKPGGRNAEMLYHFNPSEDLNLAFDVVEKAWNQFAVKRMLSGKYEATAFCDGDDAWSRFDEQSTPALAICAAILKAKGYDFMAGRMDAMGGLEPGERK